MTIYESDVLFKNIRCIITYYTLHSAESARKRDEDKDNYEKDDNN